MADCVSNPNSLSDQFTTLFLLNEACKNAKMGPIGDRIFREGKKITLESEGKRNVARDLYQAWQAFNDAGISADQFRAAADRILNPPRDNAAPGGAEAKAAQIREIFLLKKEGALTDAEFQQLKSEIIAS
eukprot:Hpha_TRINITY_DN15290_c3_g14::TRINITY_DN15290_c3_g14_i1::g.64782::m.64782